MMGYLWLWHCRQKLSEVAPRYLLLITNIYDEATQCRYNAAILGERLVVNLTVLSVVTGRCEVNCEVEQWEFWT